MDLSVFRPLHTPSNLKSLHLLRALLREASYLPDANARLFFRRYIVHRFKAYQKKRSISIEKRSPSVHRKATKGLNYLRFANLGNAVCLSKILYFTYGRIGPRKYRLLEDVLRPEGVVPSSWPLQELYRSNQRYLSFFDAPIKANPTHHGIHISQHYPRLQATIKAQCQNDVVLRGAGIKRPYLLTPINNVWERPMPINRARNNVKRWYADTMTRLLPPLPSEEFDAIQAMLDGTKPFSLVNRRTPAVQHVPAEEIPEVERFTKLVHDALVLEKPARADKIAGKRPNARLMKRLYAMLLPYCSKLEWNEKANKWESIWGSRLRGIKLDIDSEAASSLFAGVDAHGKAPVEPSAPRDIAAERRIGSFLGHTLKDYKTGRSKKENYSAIPFYVDLLPPDHPIRVAADQVRTGNIDT